MYAAALLQINEICKSKNSDNRRYSEPKRKHRNTLPHCILTFCILKLDLKGQDAKGSGRLTQYIWLAPAVARPIFAKN